MFHKFEACSLLLHPYAWKGAFPQILQPPKTLLTELLDTRLGAGTTCGRRGQGGLGQSQCRHIILPIQGLHHPLEVSLLLSEIMLHTGEERQREKEEETGEAAGSQLEFELGSVKVKFIKIANLFTNGDQIWGYRGAYEQRVMTTGIGVLCRKRDQREGLRRGERRSFSDIKM